MELLGVKGDKQMIILMLKYTVYNVKLFYFSTKEIKNGKEWLSRSFKLEADVHNISTLSRGSLSSHEKHHLLF
jgi:hypothetical protein